MHNLGLMHTPLVRYFLLPALVAIAAILTYSNHYDNAFHFDDSHTVVNNIYIRDLGNIPQFFTDGTTFSSLPSNQSYRPLVTTTLAIDYHFAGGLTDPFYFHLSTFILFLLQGVLIFFLCKKIFDLVVSSDWNYFVALIAAAWYLLHPANAETINYVIARSDSISTLFVVLAFVMYMYSKVCRRFYLYLLPVFIGALAKPTTVMFAPMLFFYVYLFEKKLPLSDLLSRDFFKAMLPSLVATLPAFVFCIATYAFIWFMEPPTWVAGGGSPFHYRITQPYVMIYYVLTFFFPIHLSADTDWTVLDSLFNVRVWIGIFFVLFLLAIAVVTSRKENMRPIAFGILWFFLALFPTSYVALAEVMNDHRLFYPYVGLALAVCWAVAVVMMKYADRVAKLKVLIAISIVLALGGYAYGTWQRNEVWDTDESLWLDVTHKSPKNARGLMNYGLVLMCRADYKGAEEYFNRARELWPRYSYIHINLGVLKQATGDMEAAEKMFRDAIAFGPIYPECYYYYAKFLYNQKRYDEAVFHLRKTLELSSAHITARHLLMEIYYERQEFELMNKVANETLQIVPGDATSVKYLNSPQDKTSRLDQAIIKASNEPTPENYLDLSLRFYEAGDYVKCIAAAEDAIKLKADYDLAYNNICSAYNMLKEWDKAIAAGTKALEINPANELAKNNVAWAQSQKNK